MLDFLKKLLEPESSSSSYEAICEQAIQEYKSDYLDNEEFLSHFREPIKKKVKQSIISGLEYVYESDNIAGKKYSIFHLFGTIRHIYMYLWLEETNYGDRLAEKEAQLLYIDDYGDICRDDWNRELNSFVKKRFFSLNDMLDENIPEKYKNLNDKLGLQNFLMFDDPETNDKEHIEDAAMLISSMIDDYSDMRIEEHDDAELDDVTDPYEYEQAISNELESLGWNSRATSGSGDQGADVIAEKNGIKLIVQCKLYSSPVGNKAVQEVSAAKGFYFGHCCAVISNQEFTKSAKQLADSLDVFLLHHSQIQAFDELLFED